MEDAPAFGNLLYLEATMSMEFAGNAVSAAAAAGSIDALAQSSPDAVTPIFWKMFASVQRAEAMLRDAGFSDVQVRELEEDPFNAYFVAKKQ